MLTAGLPGASVIVASSHSKSRTGVAPPTCWKSTDMWSKLALSIW